MGDARAGQKVVGWGCGLGKRSRDAERLMLSAGAAGAAAGSRLPPPASKLSPWARAVPSLSSQLPPQVCEAAHT